MGAPRWNWIVGLFNERVTRVPMGGGRRENGECYCVKPLFARGGERATYWSLLSSLEPPSRTD
eukprot:939775-Rhodomonas_salina.1